METGAQQGLKNLLADVSHPSSDAFPGGDWPAELPNLSATGDPVVSQSLTGIVNDLSVALSQVNSLLGATADIVNALTTVLPANEITIFANFLQEGDLVDAIGMPAAFGTGLDALAADFVAIIFAESLPSIEHDISGIFQ